MFFHKDTIQSRIEELQGEYIMHQGLKQHMEYVNAYYQRHGTVKGCPNVTESAAVLIDNGIKDGTFADSQPYSKYDLSHEFYEMQRIENELNVLGSHAEKVDIPLPKEIIEDAQEKPFYMTALDKPLEEISEDIFLRADAFSDAPWYDDFVTFRSIGVCEPKRDHALEVQKALKMMGYVTHTKERDGRLYVVPGEAPPHKAEKNRDRER